MNKEQLLEQVRSGKLAIENDPTFKDNTLKNLRKCLRIIWPNDEVSNEAQGTGEYYFSLNYNKWDGNNKTNLPTIKVREALQILKEPNMEEQIKELTEKVKSIETTLSILEKRLSEPKTALVEPECPYKEGELIWVRILDKWQLRYSNGELDSNGYAITYDSQKKDGNTNSWKFHASTNGLKLPE